MTDSATARELMASADLIHSAEAVDAAVSRVAREVTETLADTHPLLLWRDERRRPRSPDS